VVVNALAVEVIVSQQLAVISKKTRIFRLLMFSSEKQYMILFEKLDEYGPFLWLRFRAVEV